MENKSLGIILIDGLNICDNLDWEKIKNAEQFLELNPEQMLLREIDDLILPQKVINQNIPIKSSFEKPLKELPEKPKEPFLGYSVSAMKFYTDQQKIDYLQWIEEEKDKYKSLLEAWEEKCEKVNAINVQLLAKYEKHENLLNKILSSKINEIAEQDKQLEIQYQEKLKSYELRLNAKLESIDRQVKEWKKRKEEFYLSQESYKKQVDKIRLAYTQNDISIMPQYAQLVLKSSQYPDFINKNFDIDYNPETKILVVEYSLPSIEVLPTLKEVKWVGNEQREYHVSEKQLQIDFEKTMYNITLRTIYELFHTDAINAIDSICFNGWVSVLNRATGNRENHCILSLQVSKNIFNELDLRNVDPKMCFKSLKGVSSSKLHTITSIQPIIHINCNDKRFVDSHDVTGNINESTNLAAMDWEEFEHLIREIFEKEFRTNGGDVKVTQASRDGGVDAIAFDPDPIRGGKIVIQAKRYTNTVGVSAVRDLFGTVMNEGANKGILVTTSDYGSDSYEFAKGKPLTLLNGANLLYLLEKHGHNARIDIVEARRLIKI
jgi:restriction system protein